jgi:hypothetical protein
MKKAYENTCSEKLILFRVAYRNPGTLLKFQRSLLQFSKLYFKFSVRYFNLGTLLFPETLFQR